MARIAQEARIDWMWLTSNRISRRRVVALVSSSLSVLEGGGTGGGESPLHPFSWCNHPHDETAYGDDP